MKKLITDVYKKKAFGFHSNIYKKLIQKLDGITMGSSLGPVIDNIFMTTCEIFIFMAILLSFTDGM